MQKYPGASDIYADGWVAIIKYNDWVPVETRISTHGDASNNNDW